MSAATAEAAVLLRDAEPAAYFTPAAAPVGGVEAPANDVEAPARPRLAIRRASRLARREARAI